jgi:hypothetical protein
MAAFMPGASPPEVRSPTLLMLEFIIEICIFEKLMVICLDNL